MKREIRMEEISDGKLYGPEDMVRAGCGDCAGCSACCRGMGNSVIVDPLDIYRLNILGKVGMNELFSGYLEFHVEDGVILPHLKMAGEEEACGFLDDSGRCRIHPFRPGLCRLFPLGRFYEDGGFRYFLQVNECRRTSRSKVKVKRFIDTPDLEENERFVTDWHYFLLDVQEFLKKGAGQEKAKEINMKLLQIFFLTPYSGDRDFYEQFRERLPLGRQLLEE